MKYAINPQMAGDDRLGFIPHHVRLGAVIDYAQTPGRWVCDSHMQDFRQAALGCDGRIVARNIRDIEGQILCIGIELNGAANNRA